MLLQRKYYHDPDGIKSPVVNGVVIKRLSVNGAQNFSPKLVRTGKSERWLSMSAGKIIVHDQSGDMVFNITREPGRYCCHCGARLSDDSNGAAARAHVEEVHGGEVSPDPLNPAGYEMITYYETVAEGSNHG